MAAKRKSIKQPPRPKKVKQPPRPVHKPIESPLRKLVRTATAKGAFAAPDVVPVEVPPVFAEPLPIPPGRPEPKPEPEPELPKSVEEQVGALLTESWAHHVNRLAAMKKQDRDGSRRCAQLALDCRMQAHRLDPKHEAVDWQLEQHRVKHRDTHEAMVEFYKTVLGV